MDGDRRTTLFVIILIAAFCVATEGFSEQYKEKAKAPHIEPYIDWVGGSCVSRDSTFVVPPGRVAACFSSGTLANAPTNACQGGGSPNEYGFTISAAGGTAILYRSSIRYRPQLSETDGPPPLATLQLPAGSYIAKVHGGISTAAKITYVLQPAMGNFGGIVINVSDEKTKKQLGPADGVTITATPALILPFIPNPFNKGAFANLNVPAVKYTVNVSAPNHEKKSKTVTVVACKDLAVDFSLKSQAPPPPTTGIVTGTVTKVGTNTPIDNTILSFGTLTAKTDAKGNYALKDIPAGKAELSASKEGYQSEKKTVTVVAGKTLDVDFSLQLLAGSVTGVAIDAQTKEGIRDASVSIGSLSTKTDSNGKYTLQGIPIGKSEISITKAGYLTEKQSLTIQKGQSAHADFALKSLMQPFNYKVLNSKTSNNIHVGTVLQFQLIGGKAPYSVISANAALTNVRQVSANMYEVRAVAPGSTNIILKDSAGKEIKHSLTITK
jgi:hypothetical protein